jgi:integrase
MSKKNLTGVTENPCDLVRCRGALSLTFASKRRSAYWSYDLINAITTVWSTSTRRPLCPDWLVPIMWASYYTGMRLGEVLGLKRHQVYLHRRMIFMTTLDQKIKEGEPKRVPIHRDLEPHVESALRVRALGVDNVFLLSDRKGTRPVTKDCVELAMRRIVKVLNPNPRFSFHNLRHTFKANCRRSGIPEVISERICGHADADGYLDGNLPVSQRYGRMSDDEFMDAIDNITVNHGYSEINAKPVSLFGLRQNLQSITTSYDAKPSESWSPVRKKSAVG